MLRYSLMGVRKEQQRIVSRSIEAMDKVLQRDVYGLRHLSCSIDKVEQPNLDLLASIRYTCAFSSYYLVTILYTGIMTLFLALPVHCTPTKRAQNTMFNLF